MKYTDAKSASAKFIRHIDIEDGPVHPMAFSSTGKKFRVNHITLPYELAEDGVWEVRSALSVEISGYVLKKDGTEGQNWHSRWPGGDRSRYGATVRFEGEWEWINELIVTARPEGRVTLPSLEVVRDL